VYGPYLPAPALAVEGKRLQGFVVSDVIVVKVGGSLFDLPELGPRLERWLAGLAPADVLIVPGGGPTADVIRALDDLHHLGEEKAHWLALRTLALNARVLADLLPAATVLESPDARRRPLAILDPFAFCVADERDRPEEALPHAWSVSSDSIAARVAIRSRARELILLKSVTIPDGTDWDAAAAAGHVDLTFPGIVRNAGLAVRAINFRRTER
jgi:aspartokinase-like uncharacterized kinase